MPTLPYSVSSSSAFSAFDKLQGIKNYVNWKTNMHTVLLSLQQWGMVDGMIAWPVLADRGNVTPDEAMAIEAWDLRAISAYSRPSSQSFRCPNGMEAAQSSHTATTWSTYTHNSEMPAATSQTKCSMDTSLNPYIHTSLNLFITLYNDSTHDVDLLCNKFAKYEMCQKLWATKAGKAEGTSDGNVALFSQQSANKGKGKRKQDLMDVTCYGCGKKGHLWWNCLMKKDEKPKNETPKNEKPVTQGKVSTSKANKANVTTAKKPSSGALYTTIANASVHASNGPHQ